MKLLVKKLKPWAALPFNATSCSSGYDISAAIDKPIVLNKLETALIPTGISVDYGWFDYRGDFHSDYHVDIQLRARSSFFKKGLMLVNGVGTIDSDYRGEILVPVIAIKDGVIIEPMERIAQLVLTNLIKPDIISVSELTETDRGSNGFGSTTDM